MQPSTTPERNDLGQTLTALSAELEPLVPVAVRGLSQMHDERTGLFSHKALLDPAGGIMNSGGNRLYTGACAVGLLSCPEGQVEPLRGQATQALETLVRASGERDAAVLATALWGCVLAGRDDADRLAEKVVEVTDPARASSMHLGLALAGLAQWLRVDAAPPVGDAARALAAELRRRFIPAAEVFDAVGKRGERNPALRLLTSFASQVYPVLALCELALATQTDPPPEVKRVCDFLVQCQGSLGQWWWVYSTRRPTVIEGYPVYSVHQDAMALMALLPATRLRLGDYREPLTAGLRWVRGANELRESMVDEGAGLIYRAIQRRGGDADGRSGWSRRQRLAAYLAAASGRRRPAPAEVERLAECRSYHLGWLLLAAAMARTVG